MNAAKQQLIALIKAEASLVAAAEESRAVCRRVDRHDDGDQVEHTLGTLAAESFSRLAHAADHPNHPDLISLEDLGSMANDLRNGTAAMLAEMGLTLERSDDGTFQVLNKDQSEFLV